LSFFKTSFFISLANTIIKPKFASPYLNKCQGKEEKKERWDAHPPFINEANSPQSSPHWAIIPPIPSLYIRVFYSCASLKPFSIITKLQSKLQNFVTFGMGVV